MYAHDLVGRDTGGGWGVSKQTWPSHLGSKRAFMRRKRKEYYEALAALQRFLLGCAYLPPAPGGRGVPIVINLLESIGAVCRPWWRKA